MFVNQSDARMGWGLALFLLCFVTVGTTNAAETLYVNRAGLHLLTSPMMGAPNVGEPLPRAIRVNVIARQGFWLRVRPDNRPSGWAMQFDLVPEAPAREVKRKNPKNAIQKWQRSVRKHDAREGGSTAGSRAVGQTAKALGRHEKFEDVLPLVDKITDFRNRENLDTFLREGGLVPYFQPKPKGGRR